MSSAHCLDIANIRTKFQNNHSIDETDTERTQKVNGQTDGRKDNVTI